VNRIRDLWRTDRGRLVHYFVAADLATFLVVEIALTEGIHGSQVMLAVPTAIALLFTRDLPFAAPIVVWVGLCAIIAIEASPLEASDAAFLTLLFGTWSLGTYNERTKAVAGLVAAELLAAFANYQFGGGVADYFWVGTFVVVAWTTGIVLSRRAAHMREMAERARRLEEEHAAATERAVVEERQRIARELHDVIAHSVSVMTVQAGAVRRLLRPEQEKERQALETVEATGRQALTEMRRLVGLLREQGAMPEFTPQPGMKTLEKLLDGVRAAGLPVDLEVEGSPQELPPGVDLAAYRVVQEALTNALKYAGPAHAWVEVNWGEDELELTIANDGRDDGDPRAGGLGLDGMRERVALYGGEIASGTRDGGGYVVTARLPIGEGRA